MKTLCATFTVFYACLSVTSSYAHSRLPFNENDILRREKIQTFSTSASPLTNDFEVFILKDHTLWMRLFLHQSYQTIPIDVGSLIPREFVVFKNHTYVTLSDDPKWTDPVGQFLIELPPEVVVPKAPKKSAIGIAFYFGASSLGLDFAVQNAMAGHFSIAAVEAILSGCLVARGIAECRALKAYKISTLLNPATDERGEPLRIQKIHYRKIDYSIDDIELMSVYSERPIFLSEVVRRNNCRLKLIRSAPSLVPQ